MKIISLSTLPFWDKTRLRFKPKRKALNQEESQLVLRCENGDQQAYEQLYRANVEAKTNVNCCAWSWPTTTINSPFFAKE